MNRYFGWSFTTSRATRIRNLRPLCAFSRLMAPSEQYSHWHTLASSVASAETGGIRMLTFALAPSRSVTRPGRMGIKSKSDCPSLITPKHWNPTPIMPPRTSVGGPRLSGRLISTAPSPTSPRPLRSTQTMPPPTPTGIAAHYEKGEFDRAIADLNKAIEINPKSALAYCNLSSTYEEMRDERNAIAHYRKALEIDPPLDAARDDLKLLGATPGGSLFAGRNQELKGSR